jgi:cobalt/nickel transport system permease protein
MHISEGVLSPPVIFAGVGITVIGTAIGLRVMKEENIPKTALLSSSFFVASLIHIPLGPSSVHLLLNGLIGLVLGWASFPAILLGLLLQVIFFQFGGITTLGINTMNMALPAVITYYLFHKGVKKGSMHSAIICGFLAGFSGILIASIFVAFALHSTGEYFTQLGRVLIVAHIPVMVIEGIITAFVVFFLRKVKPEMLED